MAYIKKSDTTRKKAAPAPRLSNIVKPRGMSLEGWQIALRRSEPMTVCQILSRMEEKSGIGVGIGDYDDHQHIYLYGWKRREDKIQIKDKEFLPANEAMLAVLRMFAEETK